MKVLHLGKFFPPPFGGIESVMYTLLEGLKDRVDFDVLVSSKSAQSAKRDCKKYAVHESLSIGTLLGVSLCPSMPIDLRRLWEKNKYDLVHIHFPNPMAHAALGLLPKNVPLVISWHSDIIRQRSLLIFYNSFLKRILRRAKAIIVATPAHITSSDILSSFCDQSKIHVVPFGIDAENFISNPALHEKAQGIREQFKNKKLIFALGRHVGYKGFEYLVRAMAGVDQAVLLLGGSGPRTSVIQKIINDNALHDRVILLGSVPREDLPSYYLAADLFCFPSVSKNEAFGIVQLEAMACSRPIVSCELHNGASFVNENGKTGLIVPPKDSSQLAAALDFLLKREDLRMTMGEKACERVKKVFNMGNMLNGTFKVYKHVLGA